MTGQRGPLCSEFWRPRLSYAIRPVQGSGYPNHASARWSIQLKTAKLLWLTITAPERGRDLQWSASFAHHRLLAPVGFANAPTPFVAVQQAAWRALNAKPVLTPGGDEMVEEVL
jgi:hypothetical protein